MEGISLSVDERNLVDDIRHASSTSEPIGSPSLPAFRRFKTDADYPAVQRRVEPLTVADVLGENPVGNLLQNRAAFERVLINLRLNRTGRSFSKPTASALWDWTHGTLPDDPQSAQRLVDAVALIRVAFDIDQPVLDALSLSCDALDLLRADAKAAREQFLETAFERASRLKRERRYKRTVNRTHRPAKRGGERQMTPEMFKDSWLPFSPLATNSWASAPQRLSRKRALEKVHIQANQRELITIMSIDVDDPEAEKIVTSLQKIGYIPRPSFMVINPRSGHAHVAWCIDGFLSNRTQLKWVRSIKKRLETIIRGADSRYNGTFIRNPLHATHKTIWMRAETWSLADLEEYVADIKLTDELDRDAMFEGVEVDADGRNDSLYRFGFIYGCKTRKHFERGVPLSAVPGFRDGIHGAITEQNQKLSKPLTDSEISIIAWSAARQSNRSWHWFINPALQAQRSALTQKSINAPSRYKAILQLNLDGLKGPQMAQHLGITPAAARKLLSRASAWANDNDYDPADSAPILVDVALFAPSSSPRNLS